MAGLVLNGSCPHQLKFQHTSSKCSRQASAQQTETDPSLELQKALHAHQAPSMFLLTDPREDSMSSEHPRETKILRTLSSQQLKEPLALLSSSPLAHVACSLLHCCATICWEKISTPSYKIHKESRRVQGQISQLSASGCTLQTDCHRQLLIGRTRSDTSSICRRRPSCTWRSAPDLDCLSNLEDWSRPVSSRS